MVPVYNINIQLRSLIIGNNIKTSQIRVINTYKMHVSEKRGKIITFNRLKKPTKARDLSKCSPLL